MKPSEISSLLVSNHKKFLDYIRSLNDEDLIYAYPEKWSAGQQLDHILRALKPLNTLLILPPFLLKFIFGKANRPSRSYRELVAKYTTKLTAGGRATGRFVPEKINASHRAELLRKVERGSARLSQRIAAYSETEMDKVILPHPLLGKVTLREMMYFTIYHVEHHQCLIARELTARDGVAADQTTV